MAVKQTTPTGTTSTTTPAAPDPAFLTALAALLNQKPVRSQVDTGAVGSSTAPAALPAQPAYVNSYTGQVVNPTPATPTPMGTPPAGGWTPLVSPLATQMFFQSTIAPLLKQIQETGAKDTSSALGDVASHMQGLNLPPSIAAIYENRLPRETQQYGDLNTMLAQSTVMGPVYDQLMNQLAAEQKQALQTYNLEAYNAAAGTATTGAQQPPPAGAKPGGQWVNGVYIPPA
jgi:hypothetical protein